MPAAYASRTTLPYREGVEPSGSLRKVSDLHVFPLSRAYPDASWAHGRRKFFELADVAAKAGGKLAVIAPLAFEAVKRIDAIFDIERAINGRSIDERLAVRRARVAPLASDLESNRGKPP
jgi:Transposase IS66 family